MKSKSHILILAGLAIIAGSISASAQTDITITGATAFRQAAVKAIYDAFGGDAALGNTFNVAHDFPANATNQTSQLIASNRAIFVGQFPNISGTTIVRTSFNGSTEGLRAIAGLNNPSGSQAHITRNLTAYPSVGIPAGITPDYDTSPNFTTAAIRPDFSFSDVFQSTSPINTDVNNQPITFEPADAKVGVVAFTMLANDGAPARLTNVTVQQYLALLGSAAPQPLSLFTGNSTDSTVGVIAVGRNDGSGTRSTYLAETGFGVSNPVQQWIVTTAGRDVNNDVLTILTLVPANGAGTGDNATGSANNASTLWGNNAVGNGGYSSGSGMRDDFRHKTINGVTLRDGETQGAGGILYGPNYPVVMLTWISTSDAIAAQAAGAKVLTYNGVGLTIPATSGTPFSAEDTAKVTNGQYSAWGYQQLYNAPGISSEEAEFRNTLVTTYLDAAITSTANGFTLTQMDVSRPDDGQPILGITP